MDHADELELRGVIRSLGMLLGSGSESDLEAARRLVRQTRERLPDGVDIIESDPLEVVVAGHQESTAHLLKRIRQLALRCITIEQQFDGERQQNFDAYQQRLNEYREINERLRRDLKSSQELDEKRQRRGLQIISVIERDVQKAKDGRLKKSEVDWVRAQLAKLVSDTPW